MCRDIRFSCRDVSGPGGATEISRDISVPEISRDLCSAPREVEMSIFEVEMSIFEVEMSIFEVEMY